MPGNHVCCVVGCRNTRARNGVSLYSFPNRHWETERKENWIKAINRINADGTLWRPTKDSKICNVHFVGGKKSTFEQHPAYIPSIFPKVYKQETNSVKTAANKENVSDNGQIVRETRTVSTQCNLDLEDELRFDDEIEDNNVAPTYEDKACGPSEPNDIFQGFYGF